MKKPNKYDEMISYVLTGSTFLMAGISFTLQHWIALALFVAVIISFSPLVRRWKE